MAGLPACPAVHTCRLKTSPRRKPCNAVRPGCRVAVLPACSDPEAGGTHCGTAGPRPCVTIASKPREKCRAGSGTHHSHPRPARPPPPLAALRWQIHASGSSATGTTWFSSANAPAASSESAASSTKTWASPQDAAQNDEGSGAMGSTVACGLGLHQTFGSAKRRINDSERFNDRTQTK